MLDGTHHDMRDVISIALLPFFVQACGCNPDYGCVIRFRRARGEYDLARPLHAKALRDLHARRFKCAERISARGVQAVCICIVFNAARKPAFEERGHRIARLTAKRRGSRPIEIGVSR